MKPYEGPYAHCAQADCKASYPDHKWGSVVAHDEGWFRQLNGDVWCPKHIPEWVPAWREKRANRTR